MPDTISPHRSDDEPSVRPNPPETLPQGSLEPIDPLSISRPAIYTAMVEASYTDAQQRTLGSDESYRFNGATDYGTELIKSFQDIVSDILKESGKHDFKLLDVGAGGGQFAEEAMHRHQEVSGFSISASDLRNGATLVSDYKIDNVDHLLEIYGPASMDMVVTHSTTQHLPDNLKLLAEMYAVLKEGGTLLADELWISTGALSRFDLVGHLRGRGFRVEGSGTWRIKNFTLRKKDDEPRLLLPLQYQQPNPNIHVEDGVVKDQYGQKLSWSSAQVVYDLRRTK